MSPSLPTEPPAGWVPVAVAPPAPTSVRVAARAAVGVHGDKSLPAWKDAVPAAARRRVLALSGVNASLALPLTTLLLLLPALSADKGWTTTSTGGALIAGALLAAILALPLSGRVRPAKRARTAVVIAFNAAVLGLFVNLLPAFFLFLILVLLRGAVIAQGASQWRTFAFDATVPEARARTFARTHIGTLLGTALGALLAFAALAGPAIGSGQSLVISGVLAIVLSLFSLRLTDTPVGGVEPRRIQRAMGHLDDPLAGLRPTWRDSYTRLMSISTIKYALTSYVAVGWCVGTALIVPVIRLAEARDLEVGAPGLIIAVSSLVIAVTIFLSSTGLEKNRRQSPEALAAVVPLGLILGFVGLLLTGIAGPALATGLSLAGIGAYLAWIALDTTVLPVIQPEDRPAFVGLSTFSIIGGGLSALLIVSFISSTGSAERASAIAFVVVALPGILFWRRSKKLIRVSGLDLDKRLGADEDAQEFDEAVNESGSAPAISARNINFSYGSVQVLFDVSIRIEEGEMVALLGPNGVGKTTLLRVLSGLERPQLGTIRLGGIDVTDVPSSKRVAMGISQIVGGNAVFGSMTVYENLQMYGFSTGRDRATIMQGIDRAFEIFPTLADRRNQLGSTLSGGEQQMLGLSKALITRPKLLVVDEFSLGLAPIIVGELLVMVRQLNQTGTAILVVEQSVNVALNLVDRCYFMEKGQMVYEGRSADLLAQPELVQALSLGGATHDMAGSPA